MAKIDEVLAAKKCEVDPANVGVGDGLFDLDDVMCADGQYDIKLDASYAAATNERIGVTGRARLAQAGPPDHG